jgi:hypothetical protein
MTEHMLTIISSAFDGQVEYQTPFDNDSSQCNKDITSKIADNQ